MYGAILGDIIGSPYEFDMGRKVKDFPLFSRISMFTDDTVMTVAVAESLMEVLKTKGYSVPLDADATLKLEADFKASLVNSMQRWGRLYPFAGYGNRFAVWIDSDNPMPYNSYGNGSAMRVSAVGFAFDSMEMTRLFARWSAEVTHNHEEGIKGAEATASAIYLARRGASKAEIRKYIEDEFGYDLSRTCDEIRPTYRHVESCQETVPEAITAFLEGEDFEDVIRTAVSLGGDADTLTAIAGSMAEAMYKVPDSIKEKGREHLDSHIIEVVDMWYRFLDESNLL